MTIQNKKIMLSLVVMVLGIWTVIAYQIVTAVQESEEIPPSSQAINMGTSREWGKQYVFVNDIRDPFRFRLPLRKDSTKRKVVVKAKPVWTPPPLRLSGILDAKKMRTAMFEGANNQTFFLKEGDTLGGMRILRIDGKTVAYTYNKKKANFVLEP